MLVEYLLFLTSEICIGYHVRAQLFPAKWGSIQRTDSFPLRRQVLDVLPVALPGLFLVTLPVALPALLPVLLTVALPVILLAALPVLLPVALPVMISNFNILQPMRHL